MTHKTFITRSIDWIKAPEQNFLRWGIAISLVVHALFLAWSRPAQPAAELPTQNLEVVLVNAFDDQPPLAPQIIAQANLDGGGDQSARLASNSATRMGVESQDIALEAMTQQRQTLEQQQQQLLTDLLGSWSAPNPQNDNQSPDQQAVQGADPTDQQALAMNARIAAILKDIEQYNARPRKHFDAPSAIANPYTGYIDSWRQAVESAGSQHYPAQGEHRPTGSLQVTVTISAQGQIVDVVIDRPAKDPVLNQAVRRILELAGPFAPFPPAFHQTIDQLVITRTWTFTPGQLTTRTPTSP